MAENTPLLGDESVLTNSIDFTGIDIKFEKKPILIGGLAMEYYGLRKCGDDIDLIIGDEDYQILAKQYPQNREDTWGDLSVLIGKNSFLRSISRLDYVFFDKDAIEFEHYKVLSLERLFFIVGAAVRSEPDVPKRVDDFGLVLGLYYDLFRNREFTDYADQHQKYYEKAKDGTIFSGDYRLD